MPLAQGAGFPDVRILDEDPDLAIGLAEAELPAATRAAVARTHVLERGAWTPSRARPNDPAALGVLILDGLLLRSIEIGDRCATELLGEGDLMRPWQRDAEDGPLPVAVSWTVLEPARVAVLDGRFAAATVPWPAIATALVGRAMRRARWQGVFATLSHMNRVDQRVLLAFWYFAERWGRVRPDGILVRLPVTHEQLGALVGARRPSVTTALSALGEAGLLQGVARGEWLLTPAARAGVERLAPPGEALLAAA
jgi:CRP/FNR family transcriptional regulator, cyclic AMP receptor protein